MMKCAKALLMTGTRGIISKGTEGISSSSSGLRATKVLHHLTTSTQGESQKKIQTPGRWLCIDFVSSGVKSEGTRSASEP